MSAESLREQIAAEIHHEGWPIRDGWQLDPGGCSACARSLRQADAVLAVLGEVTVREQWAVQGYGETQLSEQGLADCRALGEPLMRRTVVTTQREGEWEEAE